MKKVILVAIAVFTFGFANAQDGHFKVGVHVGLPMGDIKDFYSVNLGVDVAYLLKITDKFSAGATTGYSTYLGKDKKYEILGVSGTIKTENAGFIPIAATGQYSLTDNFFVGLDLGYAIYAGSGHTDGGFLYQPKFGYQNEKIELYAGYKGIESVGTFSSLNLGFNYKF
ncbi:hypothetical protein [Flavobacterium sp. KACC 22761]|uniref:hypothetical protein n=1 Tax=Flavobacterium sp. KACC 22761 TaxID=3092665 RepID=UPI002A74E578|nr:hypothetical protein [Flavobacterium sp. KACC 22761]WPO79284.1 hypothetical protein SCB73_02655 [Flavobacterium sp. KACC 22761]